jgi:periplasmic copper chaperone A
MGPDRPGAGYLTIHNTIGNDDALVGVSSPVATSVEIHETMSGDSGMMGMQPVDRIEVKVGSSVILEPGGYHLMLMGVTDMPAVGETVELTLTFAHAGDIVVQAEVRAG